MAVKTAITVLIFALMFCLGASVTFAQETTISTLPVNSFWILTNAYHQEVFEGIPFKIVIFSYDSKGTQTLGFNGNATLSLQKGSITPSTISFRDGTSGPMVTITGTASAIITVDDGRGHIGVSLPISINAPSPTPYPTLTHSLTLMPTDRNAPHMELTDWLLYFMSLIVIGIVFAPILLLLFESTEKQTGPCITKPLLAHYPSLRSKKYCFLADLLGSGLNSALNRFA